MSATLAARILRGVGELGQELPSGAGDKLARLLALLERWNTRVNLTAITGTEEAVVRHLLDSLSIRPYLEGRRVLDLGTGAGFPGLPLAVAEPRRDFVLLDSNRRKIAFVRHAVGELGLGNVEPVCARAEHYVPPRPFDTAVARALAALPTAAALSAPLLCEDGVLLAQKGRRPDAEVDALAGTAQGWVVDVVALCVPGLSEERHLVRARRRGAPGR